MFKKFFLFITVFSVLVLGAVKVFSAKSTYPDSWWQVIPESELQSWEIPPQAANRENNEVILSKRTELGVFSNLAASEIVFEEQSYASIEGFWQGLKYPEDTNDERLKDPAVVWPFKREQVYAMSGFEAKHAGDVANQNMKKLGIKWVSYKGEKFDYNTTDGGQKKHYDLIYRLSKEKVSQHPEIKKLLVQTGDLKFFPDHKQAADAAPSYKYFDIYMKIRSEINESGKE